MFGQGLLVLVLSSFILKARASAFSDPQPVLQPSIPRQPGLKIVLPGCGGWDKNLCHTKCGMNIPGNTDLLARLAWTDGFDEHEDWEAVVDRPLAVSEAVPMALNLTEVFRRKAKQSMKRWSIKREICSSNVERYAEAIKGRSPLNTSLYSFLKGTFRSMEPLYKQMLLDQVTLWYAEDMFRRILDGIERNCPEIAYDGLPGDPCYSPPPSLEIMLKPTN